MESILPEIFLATAGFVLLMMGVLRGNKYTRSMCSAVNIFFALTLLFLLWISWDKTLLFNGMFVMDRFAGVMKLLILVGLIASLSISVRYLYQENIQRFEYPILMLFAGLGMMLMVSAHNFLSLYMALELQSLALYVLAAIQRNNLRSSEAAIKYFVLGALASGMLLFGISLIYGFAGSLDFAVLAKTLNVADAPMGVIVGMVFIIAGLAFKISAVPFHMWTPDVYEGVPTSVTAFFAIVPKVAGVALLMRVLFEPFGSMVADWQQIIYFLAVASMVLGSFAALVQNNIKRLLAYSSIGNIGYALIGVVAGSQQGVGAVIVYMMLYMVMSAGLFGLVLAMRRDERAAEDISDLAGLSRTHPLFAYGFAILLISMMGIPPFAGFFGKFLIFKAAVDQGFFVLAVIGVLTSVVAAYYYLRVVKIMFFDEPADEFDNDVSFAVRTVIFLSVAFISAFILLPEQIINMGRDAASVLFMR
jgi:NADH-quinone oxidoreductase subunit N